MKNRIINVGILFGVVFLPFTVLTSTTRATDSWNVDSIGCYSLPHGGWTPYVVYPYVYIASDSDGLLILDITDPSNPCFVGSYDNVDFHGWGLNVEGDYAFITDGYHHDYGGLTIINISEPGDPYLVQHVTAPHETRDVVAYNSYAYVSSGYGGLRIIDIDPPEQAHEVSYLSTDNAHHFCLEYPFIFLGDWSGGLRIIDVSHAYDPEIISIINPGSFTYNCYLLGSLVFITNKDIGLLIYDVTNPEDPSLVSSYRSARMTSTTGGVRVNGRFAYVTGPFDGLTVIDVSDPSNCVEVGYYDPEPVTRYLFTDKSDFIHLCTEEQYLILKFNDETDVDDDESPFPQNYTLLNNYPNPFNTSTTIPLKISRDGNVSLKIYNVTGQLMEVLYNGYLQAGQHNTNWNASSMASGIYFYKLTTINKTLTNQMTLLK